MELNTEIVVFGILSSVIVVFSIMAVCTRRILRSATYLLFVLFATAGLYFQLNYSFLGATQLTIYAGGVIVLYVFSILLTSTDREDHLRFRSIHFWIGTLSAVLGLVVCLIVILHQDFPIPQGFGEEIDMKDIGQALMGTEKYQYILPFEIISILLLACIVGGITIARKRN